ncbi:ExeA family protein [Rubrimonas cliftonensis]|uniref:Type II secretory pathway, component ExeA (Predicted ATPase) n=1 Tax=Rubrimonas cliftonensis TaxID=89524 RepID=A0A1H4CVX2_9RHOB|nr:AAA family ATPase [Rubrimonas cliftonensis]SEA64252.1 Type II secretory pathway, component ExeA (predicted ATPase) [Rubrimonas cliftonensis]
MYEEFYRLRHRPFSTLPDPSFMYWSEAHTMGITMLRYGLMSRAPITVVTGEIGAGKTTLIRQLLREAGEDVRLGLVSNMQPGRGDLLQWVLMALDERPGDDGYVTLFRRFQDIVVDTYARGRRVVLIFDEAQNLSVDLLEELRMLSNMNSEGDELLQLVLVGQPQLRDLIERPELTQFRQRVTADFHLEPLSAEEVEAYIHHRMELAGAAWRVFLPHTCKLVHEACRGVPRIVNSLCDLCLVYGFATEQRVIDETLLREFLAGAHQRGLYSQFKPLDKTPTLVKGTG